MNPRPMAPASTAQSIDRTLVAFERATSQWRTSEATQLSIELLQAIIKARSPSGLMPPGTPVAVRTARYTRIASMISMLVSSPDFRPDAGQLDQLTTLKPTLEAIFKLSGYGGAAHLIDLLGQIAPDGSRNLTASHAFLLGLLLALEDVPEGLLRGLLQLPADQLLPLFAGWMATPFVQGDAGRRNRAQLIDQRRLVEAGRPSPAVIGLVNSAWMHCSYIDHPEKHAVKRSLNQVWRSLAGNALVSSAPRRHVERPTMVIAAERMLSGHAMQRSYASSLRQLRRRFRTVCVVASGHVSQEAAELFDELVVLPSTPDLASLSARLAQIAPDLIYYPSLGMSEWTQIAANQRLAPIQVFTLGHPAPACCDTIDYSLVQAGHGEAAWEFGRKVIERRGWGQFDAFDPSMSYDIAKQAFPDGRLHIAVNSSLMKLSSRFLQVCERIQAEAARPVHFHFFASAMGIMFDRLSLELEQRFKHYTLEPSRDYAGFLAILNRCDLALAAFPFGNTNSTVDTCLLGVPTVGYFANEVLSIGDRDVMRLAGLPSWLIADNDEDYFKTAMKLIHSDETRQAIVAQLKATDVKARLFQPSHLEEETEFVDAFDWIYRHHEALQASSKRLLKVGELIPA